MYLHRSQAWRDGSGTTLQTQTWRVIRVDPCNDEILGRLYLIKSLLDEGAGYHVMLSDSSDVWEERLGTEEVLQRLKVSLSTLQQVLESQSGLSDTLVAHTQALAKARVCDTTLTFQY